MITSWVPEEHDPLADELATQDPWSDTDHRTTNR